ncbi:MAG: DUF523 domain-containing protein [Mariprofundales bacterium]|nr:DUF523 domain-containing protein [Mariprofundales bacterium]
MRHSLPVDGAIGAPLRILVSACLLGALVRYDGGSCRTAALAGYDDIQWIPICPEVAGGLPVPRPPAQIVAPGVVQTEAGDDVSAWFHAGAECALQCCLQSGIRVAVLKEGSPSCGVHEIHDGNLLGRRVAGQGVTAQRLLAAGVAVFNEHEVADAVMASRRLAL